MWSPAVDLLDGAHEQPADGALEQPRVVLADGDAVPEHERRHAAREVLGEMILVAGEQRDAHSPASRSTSYSEAERASEMPTSGGASESETSELTVSPARRPPASATTTETPVGQRRKRARCSAPWSSTVPRLAHVL